MIKVLHVEDNVVVSEGIRLLLEQDGEVEVIGQAKNGKEALEMIDKIPADVVLTDYRMPGMNGLDLIKELKARDIETPIMVLSMHNSECYVNRVFQEGASGYLLKNTNVDELIFALKHVALGNKYLCSEIAIEMALR